MFAPQIQAIKIVIACAVMVFCGWLGYDYGSSKQIAEQKKSIAVANKELNQNALDSQAKSLSTENTVTANNNHIGSIKQQAVQRVEEREPKIVTKVVTKYIKEQNESCNNAKLPTDKRTDEIGNSWTFDNGTVRLLNSARSIDANSTAFSDNAFDQTPSRVKVSDFVKNDLEVVALYHEQSTRFKALQDYIKDKQDNGYMLCKLEKSP